MTVDQAGDRAAVQVLLRPGALLGPGLVNAYRLLAVPVALDLHASGIVGAAAIAMVAD